MTLEGEVASVTQTQLTHLAQLLIVTHFNDIQYISHVMLTSYIAKKIQFIINSYTTMY